MSFTVNSLYCSKVVERSEAKLQYSLVKIETKRHLGALRRESDAVHSPRLPVRVRRRTGRTPSHRRLTRGQHRTGSEACCLRLLCWRYCNRPVDREMFRWKDQQKHYNAMKKLGSKQPQKPIRTGRTSSYRAAKLPTPGRTRRPDLRERSNPLHRHSRRAHQKLPRRRPGHGRTRRPQEGISYLFIYRLLPSVL